ncbi:hypothetical protein ES703_50098 [subsurface metagenome]
MDFGVMNKVSYLLNWGANIGAETSPILGGYSGGPARTAVLSTAYILMRLLALRGNYQLTFPFHFNYGCSTSRDVIMGGFIKLPGRKQEYSYAGYMAWVYGCRP